MAQRSKAVRTITPESSFLVPPGHLGSGTLRKLASKVIAALNAGSMSPAPPKPKRQGVRIVAERIVAHGGILRLTFKVKRGQTVVLVNSFTGEERECRVVYTGAKAKAKAKKQVALEFTANNGDFWHVYAVVADLKITRSSN